MEFLEIQPLILSVPHLVTALRGIVLFINFWLILPSFLMFFYILV